jgi:hypothetical protein
MSAQVIERSTRVGNECFDSIPAGATVRPLRDQLFIEPIPWPFSDIIEVVYTGRPLRGRVLAAGPGCYEKRYDGPKGKRTKMWDSPHFSPTEVKVGDVVQLGGLSIDGYLFQTVRWGDKTCVICRERDVTGVEEGEFKLHPRLAAVKGFHL